MDLNSILVDLIQEFITNNLNENISKLALKKNPFTEIDYKIILNQIESKTKAKEKLPTWFQSKKIIYPQKISIEQTSSEVTALYKSNLLSGESMVDLTGGFGVDCYYFSKTFKKVFHCEINEELSKIAQHNFNIFKQKNIITLNEDGLSFLKKANQSFDLVYIDPSRRSDSKGKVFLLKDCLPNVPELLNEYFKYTKTILIKTAPLLDISAGLNELKFVKEIHIIALENEVKELLWVIEKNFINNITIKTVNIAKTSKTVLNFDYYQNSNINYSEPLKYLFEPNAAILKSGKFNELSSIFNINKLHQHSHLFSSNDIIDFPGRRFEIKQILEFNKENMKVLSKLKKINITLRNFPDTVENIRKKWKLYEGGTTYVFFTTNMNNKKIILICTKI